MDLLKKFDTQASYDAIKDSLEYPTVSYVTENDLVYFMQPSLYEWVDLGLSVKWAAWNVGATKPEEYGLYFAWGETQGYTGTTNEKGFYWGDYKYTSGACTGTTDTSFRGGLTKYNSQPTSGVVDNLTTLESSDDAASVTQSTCRMPTKAEFDELKANTTTAWTSDYNGSGVSGVIFTSKVEGYTNKSIFLPAAGLCTFGSSYGDGSNGYYWSSSLDDEDSRLAWNFNFIAGDADLYYFERNFGQRVRAVLPKS